MTIGNIIRTHRKTIGLTQEEMANRLGVTAPAVNKWESGATYPDISLLAPIARLLGITTDTLLSFRDELTDEEITLFVRELDNNLETKPYAEVFLLAEQKIKEYPNCTKLMLNTALLLESHKLFNDIPDKDAYDEKLLKWYLRVLESEDNTLKKSAAQSLYCFYVNRNQYKDAEKYLAYFPEDDHDRKRYQALIYQNTGKTEEAYKALENLMLSDFNELRITLSELCILYMKDDNHAMAHKFADIAGALAELFEMGAYQGASSQLELATWEKDAAETERIMRILLENCGSLTDFFHSDLYSHIPPKKADSSLFRQMKRNLIKGFLDEETYGYMKGNEYWEALKTAFGQ